MKYLSSNEEYYLKYGLNRDPFPEDVIDNIFFLTPDLNHRIELIKHLLEFSQQLLLVTAPSGAGKSTLCKYLPSGFDETWPTCLVSANEEMDPEALASAIIEGIYAEKDSEAVPSASRLHKYLEYCYRDHMSPVIIIDDGHKLSIDTLEFILQLNELIYNNTRYKFIIFGDEKINDSLDDPRIKVLTTGILHNISIPLLTEEQTPAYIQHRLSSSGEINQYPFTDKDAEHIYKVSAGIPGKINRLARQAMQDPAELYAGQGRSYPLFNSALLKGLSNPIVIALIICIVFAGYFFIGQRQANDQPQSIAIVLPAEQRLIKSDDNRLQDVEVNKSEDQLAGSSEQVDDSILDSSAEELYMESMQEQQTMVTKQETVMIALDEPPQVLIDFDRDSSTIEATVQKPAAKIKIESDRPEQISVLFSGLRGANWVGSQDPEKYVLQLIGARDVNTLEQYLEGFPGIHENLTIIATYNEAKPWYVFIYGLYPDRSAAIADLNNLPAKIRQSQPWPRPVASVQLDLEKER